MILAIGIAALVVWFASFMATIALPSTAVPTAVDIIALTFFLSGIVGCVVCAWHFAVSRGNVVSRRIALLAITLFAASYLTTVGIGTIWVGPQDILVTQNLRYLPLQADNLLPHLFAQGLRDGHVPSPLLGDWYAADRPPLQVGFLLIFSGVISHLPGIRIGDADGYVAIACQSLFAIAAFRFARTISRSLVVGTIAAVASFLLPAAGEYIFFPWPKLLAAAFLLTSISLTLDLLRQRTPLQRSLLPLVGGWGIALSLALLSHGGVIFTAIPLVIAFVVIVWRRTPQWNTRGLLIGAAFTCQAAVYAPWLAYQRISGDDHGRLIKWFFAGVIAPSRTSPTTAIFEAYSRLSFDQWLASRLANFKTLYAGAGSPTSFASLVNSIGNVPAWRVADFYVLAYSTALAAIWLVPVALLLATHRRVRLQQAVHPIGWSIVLVASTLVVWCLALFLPGTTVPHVGSVVVIFLPVVVLSLAVAMLSFRAAILTLIIQAGAFGYVSMPPLGKQFSASPPLSSISFVPAIALATGVVLAYGAILTSRRHGPKTNSR